MILMSQKLIDRGLYEPVNNKLIGDWLYNSASTYYRRKAEEMLNEGESVTSFSLHPNRRFIVAIVKKIVDGVLYTNTHQIQIKKFKAWVKSAIFMNRVDLIFPSHTLFPGGHESEIEKTCVEISSHGEYHPSKERNPGFTPAMAFYGTDELHFIRPVRGINRFQQIN